MSMRSVNDLSTMVVRHLPTIHVKVDVSTAGQGIGSQLRGVSSIWVGPMSLVMNTAYPWQGGRPYCMLSMTYLMMNVRYLPLL